MKPFVKWAGGKTKLISKIVAKMPNKYNKYIEPFVGGGSLFFIFNPTILFWTISIVNW
ncbi:DNA adenine methylase [Mycoplasma sp. CSL7475-4]|uniref:DNA adenine methylase n=1 Tax=Mycoplasma sp. CSL7475-4 TaxID=2973942 RepID=UPI00216AB387|nr:DNA adenine methylase [Mycoplasma sp. CSL7475-4]MCS4537063.1 DNA adenine methylase [Mycoplasma sp. CSL7475-4]